MVRLLKDHKGILFVIALAILAHWSWFTFKTFTFGDTGYTYPETLKNYITELEHTGWQSTLNFGAPQVEPYFFISYMIRGGLSLIGLFTSVNMFVYYFLPIILVAPIGSYLFVRKLLKDNFLGTIGSIIYTFNTYFLTLQTQHLPLALAYSLAPLTLFTYYSLIDKLKKGTGDTWKMSVVFALIFTLQIVSEPRIVYIICPLLLLPLVWPARFSVAWFKYLFLAGILVVLLNMFWMPLFMHAGSSEASKLTGQPLFGSQFKSTAYSLTIFRSSWTGGASVPFSINPIPLFYWLIPIAAFAAFAVKDNGNKRREVVAWAAIGILGIFLAKQNNSPFSGVYVWLYTYFPGFNLFREASKFYILIALSYSILIPYSISKLRYLLKAARGIHSTTVTRLTSLAIVTVVSGIFIYNTWPLVTLKIGGLFKPRDIPAQYLKLKSEIESQKDFSRTLWIPSASRWGYYQYNHPRVDASTLAGSGLSYLEHPTDEEVPSYIMTMLDATATKYVIVPARDPTNSDVSYPAFGDDRQYFIDALDNVGFLAREGKGVVDTDTPIVYTNKDFGPYVSASTSLLEFPNQANIDQLYRFGRSLSSSTGFTSDDSHSSDEATAVRDVFGDPHSLSVKASGTESTIRSRNARTYIYMNTNKPRLSYALQSGSIRLSVSRSSNLEVNGRMLNSGASGQELVGAIPYNAERYYYLLTKNNTTPLDVQNNSSRNLGQLAGEARIASTGEENLISNPSLENGLWQKQVEDCNPYNSKPSLLMKQDSSEHSQGTKSLKMTAVKHSACSGPNPVAISAGQTYLFRFDYKAKYTKEISYAISFNDPKHTTVRKYPILGSSSHWHTVSFSLEAPAGATRLTIKVALAANNQSNDRPATAYFDNLSLAPLTTDLTPAIDTKPKYLSIALQEKTNTFKYVDSTYDGKNLVPNPSLEKGLWQKKVGDCYAHDNYPDLNMALSHHASKGGNSLELDAKRHIACTSTPRIRVQENMPYLFGFDYQSPDTKQAKYSIDFDDPDHTIEYGSLPAKNKWRTYSSVVNVPSGAHSMRITVNADSPQGNRNYTINRYDNFRVIALPDVQNQFYLVNKQSQEMEKPGNIAYTDVNTSKKLIHVTSAGKPFFLTMSEAFNTGWRLELNDKVGHFPVPRPYHILSDHIDWDNLTNGWYVNPGELCNTGSEACTRNADGSYDLELVAEFTPQRWFNLGFPISSITLIGCVLYLVYDWRKRRKQKHA